VGSNAAAKAIGVGRGTLWRWWKAGHVVPAWVTPAGQARWDLADLRRQLRKREEAAMPEPSTTPERPPIVAAIVTSHLGVLLTYRNDGAPPVGFVTGEIEPLENQVDAAVREVKEETGLRVRAGHQEIGRRVHPRSRRTIIYLACTPTEGTDVFVGDTDELADVRWVAGLDEIDQLMPDLFLPVREHLARTLPG
jgi:8-oxo-dGTP pyrophosphatase MutT (NUDIX family)